MARSSAGLSPDAQPDGHLINERVSLAWPAPWAACILHFNLFTCLVPLLVLGHPKSVITGALTAVKRQRALACALDAREIDRQQLLSRVRKKSFHSFSCAVSSQRERERVGASFCVSAAPHPLFTLTACCQLQHQPQLRAAAGPTLPTGPTSLCSPEWRESATVSCVRECYTCVCVRASVPVCECWAQSVNACFGIFSQRFRQPSDAAYGLT